MKAETLLQLFVVYIKQHIKVTIAFFLITAFFTLVFFLYSVPLDPIVYATLLSLIVLLLFVVYDFWMFIKYHNILQNLKNGITLGISELPPTNDLLEQDYQNLLKELERNCAKIASDADINRTEMTDYYTLWAHQIKTPISAMRLLLQMDDSKYNTDLSIELIKIEQYVEMVLQYLRLDTMSSDIILENYDLSSLIKQTIRKYAKLFILKKITLDFEECTCNVLTDEKWLVFVLEQVLSNALKYTQGGTISIYMDKVKEKTLIIEDTGIGIQEEDIPRVFEKGFTGYNGRMDKKSTGIGLFLCKRILRKLSHSIKITSTVGAGTKVHIDLFTIKAIIE